MDLIDEDEIQHFHVNALLAKSWQVSKKAFYFDAALALSEIQKSIGSPIDLPDIIFLDIIWH